MNRSRRHKSVENMFTAGIVYWANGTIVFLFGGIRRLTAEAVAKRKNEDITRAISYFFLMEWIVVHYAEKLKY